MTPVQAHFQQCPPVISPGRFQAVIFDLDGVVTQTARLHALAWKTLFDEYLQRKQGEAFQPFNPKSDYLQYIDGLPRLDGILRFLNSRGIALPQGTPQDAPMQETVWGLGNRKNELFLSLLRQDGVEVYESTVRFIHQIKARGLKTAVATSSKNCEEILASARLSELFDTRVDGLDSERLRLSGKPAPDIFLQAAKQLRIAPEQAVVVEDALSGVEAGHRGRFGLVIGVDRQQQARALYQHGADCVVRDLSELSVESPPHAVEAFVQIMQQLRQNTPALFLDYDGTLTPIADRPELAVLSDTMRETLLKVSQKMPVAIISGRDLPNVEKMVNVPGILYAGSHGFDIEGPGGMRFEHPQAKAFLPVLDELEPALKAALQDIPGILVERKKYAIAVHYRLAAPEDDERIDQIVHHVSEQFAQLALIAGKKIFEFRPDIDWHKGKALLWLVGQLNLTQSTPIYFGDDTTDEDAFRTLNEHNGIGIAVQETPRDTAANYVLHSPGEVRDFLERLHAGNR